MSNATQAKTNPPSQVEPLDPKKVKIALALRGWTQARLAGELGKALTTVNLAINHNTFPEVTRVIRAKLAKQLASL